MFRFVPAAESGIRFNNEITENDSTNILDYEYVYNGGGVAVADFNNDGLQDLYFSGNMVSNRLYLNQGQLEFKDVTDLSDTGGGDKWYTGVSVADINSDGWQDIYVCASRSSNPKRRRNELYINQGLNKDGIPVFTEQASKYGLEDTSYSTHAAFFDYDNDGDLDMYLLVSDKWQREAAQRRSSATNSPNRDKLFKNDSDSSNLHPKFVDISKEAGITKPGYGLGVAVSDINQDGWKDIYAANDYASNDLLWINNGDGTFTDKASIYFKHTSFSAMGTDIQDINNDGLADIVTADMLPENNFRKKTMTNPNNYINYRRKAFRGYDPQFTRNTLQLNRGPRSVNADSVAPPIFSEIAYLAGIAGTDWSWAPIIADFDNDGYRDLFITNGTPKDKTDKDFVNFRSSLGNIAPQSMLLDSIPEVKIPNYVFRNNGDQPGGGHGLTFEDVTEEWGMEQESFSNGTAWADLDNDGDLDLVVNNIDDEAFLYENRSNERSEGKRNNWLQVEITGEEYNTHALGSLIDIYYQNGKHQFYEYTPYRGYLSSVQNIAHFGLGKANRVDSIIISTPSGQSKILKNVEVNQRISISLSNVEKTNVKPGSEKNKITPQFTDVTEKKGIKFEHREKVVDDFSVQRLLPHKLSQYGPALAVGDVDGNGTEDIFIGGSLYNKGKFLLQKKDGQFTLKDLLPGKTGTDKMQEDQGALLFDADNDADPDLYIVSGSVENRRGSENYRDRFYENNGQGQFSHKPNALPAIRESGSAVKAADYDKDGDLDLFIGGRVIPGFYPLPASSYILRNDSRSGEITFTDVTDKIARPLQEIGMVTDALWSDFDNDGWTDLVISGEWMPVTFLKNRKGRFVDVTKESGISDKIGWWNSLAGGDFDSDGDTDYIAGNLGLNSVYQATEDQPVGIYGNDFVNNGIFTGIPTSFAPDATGKIREFPVHYRNDVISMLSRTNLVFKTHESYSKSTIHDILSEKDVEDAIIYKANYLQSSYIENKGGGKFRLSSLPIQAQFAPVFGMVTDDFDADGHLDVLLNGNDFGAQVQIGRYDALNGLLLEGDGNGSFSPKSIAESGIFIPGNGKALVSLAAADSSYLVMAGQNNAPLKLFENNSETPYITFHTMDAYAIIYFENGKIRKQEAWYGSSFLSASARILLVPPDVDSVEIVNYQGEGRAISF